MKFFLAFSFLFFSSSIFAQSSFILPQEVDRIDHKTVGNVEVLILEDFINNSLEPAEVVAIDGDVILVKRNQTLALLVPGAQYFAINETPFFVLAGDSCQSQCAGAAAGGAMTGAVGGAAAGAQAGAVFGPQAAAGGVVIGGIVGGVGGMITGFEVCKWATGCNKLMEEPKPNEEK
jgi:hypothetical protein